MEQEVYVKIGRKYHKMVKQEIDENGDSELFNAFYLDKTGELIWIKREEQEV